MTLPHDDFLIVRKGKTPGKWGKLSDEQLRTLHKLHREGGLSVRELGRRLYATGRYGFASSKSAAMALSSGWKRLHLRARDRIESTILASTTHGLRPRAGTKRAEYNELRRQRRKRQPQCAGVRTTYPSKGAPCSLPAMVGSDYCFGHAPEWAEWRDAHLAAARDRRDRMAA